MTKYLPRGPKGGCALWFKWSGGTFMSVSRLRFLKPGVRSDRDNCIPRPALGENLTFIQPVLMALAPAFR